MKNKRTKKLFHPSLAHLIYSHVLLFFHFGLLLFHSFVFPFFSETTQKKLSFLSSITKCNCLISNYDNVNFKLHSAYSLCLDHQLRGQRKKPNMILSTREDTTRRSHFNVKTWRQQLYLSFMFFSSAFCRHGITKKREKKTNEINYSLKTFSVWSIFSIYLCCFTWFSSIRFWLYFVEHLFCFS